MLRLIFPTLLLGLLVTGCQPSTEVKLTLQTAEGSSFDSLVALKVIVRTADQDEPEIYGPFNVDDEVHLQSTVPTGVRFYADVWGCPSVSACSESDVVARGCTGVEEATEGENMPLPVILYAPEATGALRCPPKF